MCSAAETTFDSGAFATTIPRLVAASTSTLSTPTPARPTTFSRVRARDHVRGDLRRGTDDQAFVPVDDLVERRVRVDVDLEVLAQQVDARIRDLLTDEDLHAVTGVSNASNARAHGDAALDVGAELDQRELHRSERGGDVEDVEPADVPDPEDLPLEMLLAGRERDAVPVAQMEQQLVAVDSVRRANGGHDSGRVVVGREELEPHRLHPGARGAAEANVPFEARLERVVEDQPERDVEAADQRDGRRERRVERVLRLLVPAPVEVEAARRLRRARARAPALRPSQARAGTSAPSASRRRPRRSPRRRSRAGRRRATRSHRRRASSRRPPP